MYLATGSRQKLVSSLNRTMLAKEPASMSQSTAITEKKGNSLEKNQVFVISSICYSQNQTTRQSQFPESMYNIKQRNDLNDNKNLKIARQRVHHDRYNLSVKR